MNANPRAGLTSIYHSQIHLHQHHLNVPSSTHSPNDHDYSYDDRQYTPTAYPYSPSNASLKSEYPPYRFNMADVPTASPNGSTKIEYPEDTSFKDNRSQLADGRLEMDQDEVDAIIRNKRKVRDPKACYACHRRKVKCDRNLPCDSCVKRDHPELCSYERPTKKKRIALNSHVSHASDGNHSDEMDMSSHSGPNVTVPKEQWERINVELSRLREAVTGTHVSVTPTQGPDSDEPQSTSRSDNAEREGIHAPSTQMGTMHLGSRSVLAYMMGNRTKSSQDTARTLLEENILPNLGLDNETATYPFVDLWSTDSSMQDVNGLCKALPEDALCLQFWESYRDVACTIYPVIPEKDVFEDQLRKMLDRRAFLNNNGLRIDPDRPYGVSMSWLALAFAMLASGAQCGMLPAKERELTSQVYICCAYQALRMANFLTHPCLETIEACLIIGNALAYNMNPGVAYIFLGMTLRSGLSMGLHVNSHGFSDHDNYLRGRIWWALAWQDSHFSVSYDRPSSSIMCFPSIMYAADSVPGNRSYVESLSAIIKLTQEILRDRTMSPTKAMAFSTIKKYRDQMYNIIADAAPRLKDRKFCQCTTEHMERLAFQLHSSYMLSEICRPALREMAQRQPTSHPGSYTPTASPQHGRRKSSGSANSAHSASSPTPTSCPADPNIQAQLRAECVRSLEGVVGAYVELHSVSIFACRSWIGIQRCISAAFILGILPETQQEPRILIMLQNLETCIAKRTSEDIGFDPKGDHLNSPVLQSVRRMSVANNGTHPPGMSESPNWARTMSKSLNALHKLNTTLATSTEQTKAQSQKSTYPTVSNSFPQQHATGMHSGRVESPMHNGQQVGNASSLMPMPLNQYPPITLSPHMHNQYAHQQGVPVSNLVNGPSPGGYTGGMNMPPMANEGNNSDWHYWNIQERALEYVQPGLWG